MKNSDDSVITFTNSTGWRISKKVALILATAFVGTCVAVGLIVYYAGVANVNGCKTLDDHADSGTSKPVNKPGHADQQHKPAKTVVKIFIKEGAVEPRGLS